MTEAHAALAPLAEFARDIFGDEYDLRCAANQFVFLRAGSGGYERKHRSSVGRGNGYPTLAGLNTGVEGEVESEVVQVESEASLWSRT